MIMPDAPDAPEEGSQFTVAGMAGKCISGFTRVLSSIMTMIHANYAPWVGQVLYFDKIEKFMKRSGRKKAVELFEGTGRINF